MTTATESANHIVPTYEPIASPQTRNHMCEHACNKLTSINITTDSVAAPSKQTLNGSFKTTLKQTLDKLFGTRFLWHHGQNKEHKELMKGIHQLT